MDWNEFVARFTIVFTRLKDGKARRHSTTLTEQPSIEREEWLIKAIELIGMNIFNNKLIIIRRVNC